MTSICFSCALRSVALGVLLASHAAATTYVIDDDGGPGVDFTDIAPAIAAASPGDVLLVRAGHYSGFTLTKGLSIFGESGVIVGLDTHGFPTGDPVVANLPNGQVAVLSNFQFFSQGHMRITSCTGTVIVQHVTGGGFQAITSRDVRLLSVSAHGFYLSDVVGAPTFSFDGAGLEARRSRVEVVQSTMIGAEGWGFDDYPGDRGSPGVAVAGPGLDTGALVHLALTSSLGGNGGIGSGTPGGFGGIGVLVGGDQPQHEEVGCDVIIAGSNRASIRGGPAGNGVGGPPCYALSGGTAIVTFDPRVRYSGVDLVPGFGCSQSGQEISADDPADVSTPTFADPTLAVVGTATASAGGTVVLKIRGEPRSKAFLFFGRRPIVANDGVAQIAQLVDVVRARKLGAIPLSGEIEQGWPIPANAHVGDLFVFQAAVRLPTGEYRRTNSVPVIVR